MTFTDQLGQAVHLTQPPRRIVSLVPSQTELLFHLGLADSVVGVTKFCVHPKQLCKAKTQIGGTKKISFDKIAALNPDLIIGNKEENERSQIEELRKHYPVWMSDIVTLADALDMIKLVGEMTETNAGASTLVTELTTALASQTLNPRPPITAAYLIWRKPWMAVGSGTFIHEMMGLAGFTNVLAAKTRYPIITLEELAEAAPQVVLLSSEPYPFTAQHFAEIHELCPSAVVKLVDGEIFSWYGSRLLLAAPYFANLRSEITATLL